MPRLESFAMHLPCHAYVCLAVTPAWPWVSATSAFHLTIFLLVAFHCLRSRREPTSTLLWIFLTWSFPAVGALLYLSFGINRLPAKGWLKARADAELREVREEFAGEDGHPLTYWRAVHREATATPSTEPAHSLNEAMNAVLAEYPLLAGNRIELLVTGQEAYPAMKAAIEGAVHHIHLQSFIIGRDEVGQSFMDLLAQKARDGVQVRVLYDRFGSTRGVLTGFFRHYRGVPNMRVVGWTQANPIKRQLQVNLRNHRKILIVDGQRAFVGGLNLSANNIARADQPPTQDYHFSLLGPIVQELQYSFLRDWYFMTDESPRLLLRKEHFPPVRNAGQALIRIVNSGPTTTEIGIVSDIFFASIVSARERILAVTPYFVPPRDILKAIRSASLRGVRVRLIFPAANNHAYAGLAGQALYEELLAAGVQIFLRAPPFVHAKAMIIDDTVALVGTANLDERSLRLNYESNLAVYDETFIYELQNALNREIEHSAQLDLAVWRQRPLRHRLLENFCNLMTPIL